MNIFVEKLFVKLKTIPTDHALTESIS
jgi:hypothetical protein